MDRDIGRPRTSDSDSSSKTSTIDLASERRFLVVDAYCDLLEALQLALEDRRHVVRTARSSKLAMQIVETYRPNVVVLDAGFLERNGGELVHWLREHPNTRHAVVIAMSGGDENADRAAIDGVGFTAYLRKPFDVDSLLDLSARRRDRA
jgi:DNA-binding response OmpR family regulator